MPLNSTFYLQREDYIKCEPIISPFKDTGVKTFCQHCENKPLSLRHNWGSDSIIGIAGE